MRGEPVDSFDEELEMEIDDGRLNKAIEEFSERPIKGEKNTETKEKKGDSYYTERSFGSFARSLRLPFEVKDEKVDAKFKDGVLTVRLPKPAEMQKAVRRIDVAAQ